MRPILSLAVAGALLVGIAAACERGNGAPPTEESETMEPPAPVASVEQVRSYPHDSTAFTQGLVWRNGRLYESTGRYEQSTLRIVELETGRVLQQSRLGGQYFAEGLAAVGDTLYQLTWKEGVAFIWDPQTLRQIGQVQYNGEGWGLASDGRRLIVSDGSSYLSFVDPTTFQLDTTLRVMDGSRPVDQLNELEWVKGEVWANVWHTQRIARIDPATGRVKGWLDLSPLIPPSTDQEAVLNGIAYDEAADRLLVTGKLWPVLYEIRVPSLNLGNGSASSSAPAPAPATPDSAAAG
ncbi:glutaminyl-peptide cyclotransferase [Longimicrobium sp.]|uniref:glutaminyl-peptide cyclotransferase n=1 Tax=Longimicrobium sp. TaxID=2029185 RepID=UPI002E31CD65|nr:glutaminyl-peptide cyclotransferase [Longimicrobium sp.]HEX6040951.1 glutaminyl-peptide cyclotransferase [Longimicrobium sp.]